MKNLHTKLLFIMITVVTPLLQVEFYLSQNYQDKAFLYPIDVTDSTYSGEGMDWLLTNSQNSHYVLFGEQHGVKQLGSFIGYTLDELQDGGFNHFGLEIDSWTIQSLKTFYQKNIEHFRDLAKLGFWVFLVSCINIGFASGDYQLHFSIVFGPLLFSMAYLILSEVFKEGKVLLEDNNMIV